MTTAGTTQTAWFSLTGVDPLCSGGAGDKGNSCGIHIHEGVSCTSNAGGHYFTELVTTDPWASIAYTSVDTSTNGTFTVDTGATSSQVEGKTLIVHAHNGDRIACAILSTGENGAFEATAFVKYYTYTGSLEVGGLVGPMSTSGDS